MNFFKNKKILVTGGTGMIGIPLVNELIKAGASVTVASLDNKKLSNPNARFLKLDLREKKNCIKVCDNQEIVFHLAGVKGSPLMTNKKPASFLVPTVTFSMNMMESARICGVEKYLFTSSIGVYANAEKFNEDSVWKTFPSKNDRFAGWGKRICELQAEAYKIEYNWNKISIVRPANVYGPYDNFDVRNAMVIPSLIQKAVSSKKILNIWGDGSPVRDFIHAKDVARAMMLVVKKGYTKPLNIGSGTGNKISEIAKIISKNVSNGPLDLKFDKTKPSGDKKRIMDTTRLKKLGFKQEIDLETGLIQTIKWFEKNKKKFDRYNPFLEN